MERRFYNDDFDFEQLIKQKSDQYKIYPSDKVWKGIYGSLHSSRRWYWLSLVLFLTGISYFAIEQLSAPPRKSITGTKENVPFGSRENVNAQKAIILPFTTPVAKNTRPSAGNSYERKVYGLPLNEMAIVTEEMNDLLTVSGEANEVTENDRPNYSIGVKNDHSEIIEKTLMPHAIPETFKENMAFMFIKKETMVQDLANNNMEAMNDKLVESNNEMSDQKRINWLQENAIYELSRPKLKRISWQLTLSPTMNYRKLTGNKNANIASDAKNIPISFNIEGDVNNLVNHKPAAGFEIGSMFLYAVSKNLTFKSGVQFNYSRYKIQAYSSYATDRATIALNNFYGTTTDSITTYTRIGNFGGNTVKDLKNEYYQLSAPIGIEVLVLGRGKFQFSVAGTIQPTYLINRDNYLITTDYKNYTHEPSLVRRWNINTGAEAFLSYKTGGFKFQLGPQLRYQLLSSYDEKYPVKEFLTEYGIKLGISKAIR
jgi:hypothetical protein